MPTYIIKQRGPSLEGYKVHQEFGYLGSYEQYAQMAWNVEGSRIFIHGDLGPHCTECAAPSDVLCDYPVGDGKTCDRPLCRDHSNHIGQDIDYCADHYSEWLAFSKTSGVMDNLARIAAKRLPPEPDFAND